MNGLGIIEQAKLRPVTSITPPVNPQNGLGIGAAYGAGVGSVRLTGIRWSFRDASGTYIMAGQAFQVRVVAINGDYSPGLYSAALVPTFAPYVAGGQGPLINQVDLSSYDVLFDEIVEGQDGSAQLWFTPLVTDEGAALTVMASSFYWPGGAPVGVTPVTRLTVEGDYSYRFRGGPPLEDVHQR